MLKKRIIPVVQVDDGVAVKSTKFQSRKVIGDPESLVKMYVDQGADEVIIINLPSTTTHGIKRESTFLRQLEKICHGVTIPISVACHFDDFSNISEVFMHGSERVLFRSAIWDNQALIKRTAEAYGSQSVALIVDLEASTNGVVTYSRTVTRRLTLGELYHVFLDARRIGVSELVVQCVDRDGSDAGYDLKTLTELRSMSDLPMIALGGCCGAEDVKHVLECGYNGAAAGTLFALKDINPLRLKAQLRGSGILLRK